jgi:RND family efflux transporter MFP subunit
MASRCRRGLVALGACLALGCGGRSEREAAGDVPTATAPTAGLPSAVPAPTEAAHEAREFIGVVFPRSRSDVATRVGGRIAELLVRQGDTVAAGDALAVLDDAQYREERGVAEALLQASRAAARQAEVARREAEEQYEALVKAGDAVARIEIDRGKFAEARAAAALQRARADVETQERRLAQLDRMLADTRVLAPFAGEVALVYLDAGETIAAGQPLVRLLSDGAPWVRFAVPAADAAAVTAGASVTIEIESLPGPVTATVRQVSPELDPISQMVLAEAELELGDATARSIRSGLAAWVHRPKPRGAEGAARE